MGEVLGSGIRLWRQKRWIARTSRAMTAVGLSNPSSTSPPGSTGWFILLGLVQSIPDSTSHGSLGWALGLARGDSLRPGATGPVEVR